MDNEVNRDRVQHPDVEMLRSIIQAVASLNFGSVEVIIQDGDIIQLERREKRRFTPGEGREK